MIANADRPAGTSTIVLALEQLLSEQQQGIGAEQPSTLQLAGHLLAGKQAPRDQDLLPESGQPSGQHRHLCLGPAVNARTGLHHAGAVGTISCHSVSGV